MFNEAAFLLQAYEQLLKLGPSNVPLLIIAANEQQAKKLYNNLQQFLPEYRYNYYPAWDTLAYEHLIVSPSIRSARLKTLYALSYKQTDCVISTYKALLTWCPSQDFINKNILILNVNQEIKLQDFCEQLARFAYNMVDVVKLPGQFAKRGGLVDVFPLNQTTPCRIDWLDDTIESIRIFDPITQQSKTTVASIDYMPAFEYIADINDHAGMHFNLATLHETPLESFFEYITGATVFMQQDVLFSDIKSALDEFSNSYLDKSLTSPELIWDYNFAAKLKQHKVLTTKTNCKEYTLEELEALISNHKVILLGANSPTNLQSKYKTIDTLSAADKPGIYYIKSDLVGSCQFNKLIINSMQKQDSLVQNIVPKKQLHHAFNSVDAFDNLKSINFGDYVVHQDYGIARFVGVESLRLRHQVGDFIKLEYANADIIYLPMYSLNMLSRYHLLENGKVVLSKLGSKQWSRKKQQALEHIDQYTNQLLQIYAARSKAVGISLIADGGSYDKFAAEFPFNYSADQLTAILEVKQDLAAKHNMDRLICGDVGFGKTEVAMHAVFIAALAGYQSLVLAPTTILVEQHYQSFVNRYQDWPINIFCLSRHTTTKARNELKQGLCDGKIDVLIGTHAALNSSFNFKKLGLLVVDEEHRFGIKHKEILRNHRVTSNILTMSATPIPRTLNMSLSNLRSLSIIQTPPENRLNIITQLTYLESTSVENAIKREIQRGGQVYFCVNNIQKLPFYKDKLQQQYPDIVIDYVHGQMPASLIKVTMQKFQTQASQLLICTTLVESGIDIPNANTIIIDRADLLGLSQLHQLRGRVGRSNLQAYACLCIPKDYELEQQARSRLNALLDHQQVGAGFSIAMQDLEIRGAGALLGSKQSGLMQSIGMATYLKLLQTSIKQKTAIRIVDDLAIDADIPAYIPHNYITSEKIRLETYCDLNACCNLKALDKLKFSLQDRFGIIPVELNNLFTINQIRCVHKNNNIVSVDIKATYIKLTIINNNDFIRKVFQSLQDPEQRLSFEQPNFLKIKYTDELALSISFIGQIIEQIYAIEY